MTSNIPVTEESSDFDRILPLHVRRVELGPQPEPIGARLLWRLRAWEMSCLSDKDNNKVWRWLFFHDIGWQAVSVAHDITVWKLPGGGREIGYMHQDRYERRKRPWVVVPKLAPLRLKPPVIRHRLFLNFDKFQAALTADTKAESCSIDRLAIRQRRTVRCVPGKKPSWCRGRVRYCGNGCPSGWSGTLMSMYSGRWKTGKKQSGSSYGNIWRRRRSRTRL